MNKAQEKFQSTLEDIASIDRDAINQHASWNRYLAVFCVQELLKICNNSTMKRERIRAARSLYERRDIVAALFNAGPEMKQEWLAMPKDKQIQLLIEHNQINDTTSPPSS